MFGRPVEVRRRTYSFGEAGVRYRYAGVERVAVPWPEALVPVVDELEACAGCASTTPSARSTPMASPVLVGTRTTSGTSLRAHPSHRSHSVPSETFKCASGRRALRFSPSAWVTARCFSWAAQLNATTNTRYRSECGASHRGSISRSASSEGHEVDANVSLNTQGRPSEGQTHSI